MDYLDVMQTAYLLDLTDRSVYDKIRCGDIKGEKTPQKKYIVRNDTLLAYVSDRQDAEKRKITKLRNYLAMQEDERKEYWLQNGYVDKRSYIPEVMEYISPVQLAELLDSTYKAMYDLIKKGKIATITLRRKKYTITLQEVERIATEYENKMHKRYDKFNEYYKAVQSDTTFEFWNEHWIAVLEYRYTKGRPVKNNGYDEV